MILLVRDGPAKQFYVWATNVHNATGASAFDVRLNYDYSRVHTPVVTYDSAWLQSTGRSPACLAGIGPSEPLGLAEGQAYASCNTFLPPAPYGALGTGKIARVQFAAQTPLGTTPVNMKASFLVDTPPNPADQQHIVASAPTITVKVVKCADFNLNGTIDLFGDIFAVAGHFGSRTGQPGWDAKYDLDGNGNIDLFSDIFNSAAQFGGSC